MVYNSLNQLGELKGEILQKKGNIVRADFYKKYAYEFM